MSVLTYGSACSGIEAASVAWSPLGFRPAWFSEIEPFPSAVLNAHWPGIYNAGDMTRLPDEVELGLVDAPDILVGGTPCQAFSVAGARRGMEDERGQLTIKYVELADAIDKERIANGDQESVIVWENVPGVLSSKDNAFGSFLGLLSGETVALEPPGGRWLNAGYVCGPQRSIAWRVLDAQYFGLAQRRRRVFVVASARKAFDPAAVLFESEGMRRDSQPCRTPEEGTAGAVADGVGVGSEGLRPFDMTAFGQYGDGSTASTCKTRDYKDATDLVVHDAAGFSCKDYGHDYSPGLSPTLRAMPGGHANGGGQVAVHIGNSTVPIQNATRGKSQNGLGVGKDGDPMYTLDIGSQHGVATPAARAVSLRGRSGGATAEIGDEVSHCLRSSGGGGDKPHVLAQSLHENQRAEVTLSDTTSSLAGTGGKPGQGYPAAFTPGEMLIRRLTPVECERLQGFPDGFTDITYRGKPVADSHRYKAIGNSMAVPCMRWIGKRIQAELNGELP